MRTPARWLGTTSVLGLAWGAAAAPPADPAALITRLGDPVYAVRETAQRDLVARGPDLLPAVEAAAGHPDPEVRDRAALVAARLRRLAEQAPLIAAGRVQLDYAGRPLADAVADFRARSGLNVQLDLAHPNPQAPVTVATAALPAWEAAEALRRAAGLREVIQAELPAPPAKPASYVPTRVNYYGGPPTPVVSAGQVPVVWAAEGPPGPELPVDGSHAVRVRALPAAFPGHQVVRGTGQVVLALDVTPPAGMRWADGATVHLDRAEDETGRPVAAAQSPPEADTVGTDAEAFLWGRGQVFGLNGGMAFLSDRAVEPAGGPRPNPRLVTVALWTNDRAVRRLRVMDGAVVGAVVVPDQPLATIADLARAAGGPPVVGVTGVRLAVTRFEARPNGTTVVGLTLEQPAGPANAALGLWMANGAGLRPSNTLAGGIPRFRNRAGQSVQASRTAIASIGNSGGQYMQMTYEFMFPEGVAPTAVTLMGPKAVEVEVPFRLRGVPLP